MDETRFWQLIDRIDRTQIGEAKDDEAALAPLVAALSAESEAEIRCFDDHVAERLWRLDGKIFAASAGPSGDSDDGFLYARCFVVSQGRAHYEAVLADPSLMPKSLDGWFEPLVSAAAQAWEAKTGAEWEHTPSHNWETGSNGAAWS